MKRDGDFLQVIQPECGKAGSINILCLLFQINPTAYTSYWSIKTANDWQAQGRASLQSFEFKQCLAVHEICNFVCDPVILVMVDWECFLCYICSKWGDGQMYCQRVFIPLITKTKLTVISSEEFIQKIQTDQLPKCSLTLMLRPSSQIISHSTTSSF